MDAVIATFLASWDLNAWLESAFYPVLYSILAGASLGIPIPEDVPLIAAGVILARQPEVASWIGTLLVGLAGVMTGDSIMYTFGRRWGTEVVKHRFVLWLFPRRRLRRMTLRFQRYGAWACFFGRFVMGVRAVMCVTAGVTKLPYWRFLLADTAGAMLSVPLFVCLGYWFANMLPTLEAYLEYLKWGVLAAVLLGVIGYGLYRRYRRQGANGRRRRVAARANRSTNNVSRAAPDVLPAPIAQCVKAAGPATILPTTMRADASPRSAPETADRQPEVLAE